MVKLEVSPVKVQKKISTMHKGSSSEASNADLEPFNKKRRISHYTPKNTDEIQENNSFVQINSSGIKFSSVNNHQKLSNPHAVVNGNCNKTLQKTINGFHSSYKSKKNSEDQISNDKSILTPSHVISSKNVSSLSDSSKCDKSKLKNSKSVHKKIVPDHNWNGNYQNGMSSSTGLFNSVSGVLPKGASSCSQGKEFKKSEMYKNTSMPMNNTNGVPMFDVSKIVSPVTGNNPFLSSLANKESKKFVGSDSTDSSIVNMVSEIDCSDFIKDYQPIKSKEQRSKYATEFNSQYKEYLKLHTQMKDVSETFLNLENRLQTCKEGSREFKKIRAKIQLESATTLQNSDYINAWKKFNFLQLKLSHIKTIIKDYDIACCEES